MITPASKLPALEKLFMPEPNSGCWLWIGHVHKDKGYGRWTLQRKPALVRKPAHVAVYEAMVGPVPAGLQLDHKCRVRCCVNPAHLEPVTPRENTLRGNGPAAKQSRKTHCSNGHPLTADNLLPDKKGYRRCRACYERLKASGYYREAVRLWRERKKQQAP